MTTSESDATPEPAAPTKKTWGRSSFIITIIIVFLASAVGKLIGRELGKEAARATSKQSSPAPASPSSWKAVNIGRLTFTSPSDLQPQPQMKDQLPVETAAMYEVFDAYKSNSTIKPMLLAIHCKAKPEIELSIDGAAQGALDKISQSIGDTTPKYTIQPTTISSRDARKITYEGKAQGISFTLEGLIVTDGSDMWMIQIFREQHDDPADTQKILTSVQIATSPAK